MTRKTIEIEPMIAFANGFLAAPDPYQQNQQMRAGVIAVLEHALLQAKRYNGYRYLTQAELTSQDKPGVRFENTPDRYMENTDPSRRCYS